MTMPKTTMDENGGLVAGEYDIGLSGESIAVKTKATPLLVK
jgi:hypothetical protein